MASVHFTPSGPTVLYDPRARYCISADPSVSPGHLNFSKSVHDTAWMRVVVQYMCIGSGNIRFSDIGCVSGYEGAQILELKVEGDALGIKSYRIPTWRFSS